MLKAKIFSENIQCHQWRFGKPFLTRFWQEWLSGSCRRGERKGRLGIFGQGSHCWVAYSRSAYLAPRCRITWRSKKLDMERSEKESIVIVQIGQVRPLQNVSMLETARRNKILQNEPYLPSRRQGLSLTWPTLILYLHLAGTQYIDVLWIY